MDQQHLNPNLIEKQHLVYTRGKTNDLLKIAYDHTSIFCDIAITPSRR